jgi:hypothetical protein
MSIDQKQDYLMREFNMDYEEILVTKNSSVSSKSIKRNKTFKTLEDSTTINNNHSKNHSNGVLSSNVSNKIDSQKIQILNGNTSNSYVNPRLK